METDVLTGLSNMIDEDADLKKALQMSLESQNAPKHNEDTEMRRALEESMAEFYAQGSKSYFMIKF